MSNKFSQPNKRKTAITVLILCVVVLGLFLSVHNAYAVLYNRTVPPKGTTVQYGANYDQIFTSNGPEAGTWTGPDGKTYKMEPDFAGSAAGSGDFSGQSTVDGKFVQSDATGNVIKGGNVVLPNNHETPPTTNDPFTVIGNIFGWILYMVAVAAGWIVSALVSTMLIIMSYPVNINLPAVTNGWAAVRDLCNNFFIVILIAVAIGTIIKIPQWQIKEILPKLLVFAILINFSKMFCGLMIDVSQILMLSFAAPLQGIQGNNIILSAIGIPDMYKLMGNTRDASESANYLQQGAATLANRENISYLNIITALIYALIASVVAAAVMVAIIAILITRIVVLLFLTVLSPLPFLLSTFKKGEQYAGQWWTEMSKNLVVGPIMLFFLWLSFMIMGYNGATKANQITTNANGGTPVDVKPTGFLDNEGKQINNSPGLTMLSKAMSTEGMINFALVIGMLIMSLVMAQKTGAAGASWAGSSLSFLDKARKGAQALPWKATKMVGTNVDDSLHVRSGLAWAGYKTFGKVPILGKQFAKMTNQVRSGTQKREDEQAANASAALRFDTMKPEDVVKYMEHGTKAQKMAAFSRINDKDYTDPSIDDNTKMRMKEAIKSFRNSGNMTVESKKRMDDSMAKRNQVMAMRVMEDEPEEFGRRIATGEVNVAELMKKLKTKEDTAMFHKALGIKEQTWNKDAKNADGTKGAWEGKSIAAQMAFKLGGDVYDGDYARAEKEIAGIQIEEVRDTLMSDEHGTFVRDLKEMATVTKTDKNGNKRQVVDDKIRTGFLRTAINNEQDVGDIAAAYQDENGNITAEGKADLKTFMDTYGKQWAKNIKDAEKRCRDTMSSKAVSDPEYQAAEKEYKGIRGNISNIMSSLEFDGSPALYDELRGVSDPDKNFMRDTTVDNLTGQFSGYIAQNTRGYTSEDQINKDLADDKISGDEAKEAKKEMEDTKKMLFAARGTIEKVSQGGVKFAPDKIRKSIEAKILKDLADKKIDESQADIQKAGADRFVESLEDMIMSQKMKDLTKVKLDGDADSDQNVALAGKLVEKKQSTEIVEILTNPQQFEKIGGALAAYLGQFIGKESDEKTPAQVKALLALKEVRDKVIMKERKGAATGSTGTVAPTASDDQSKKEVFEEYLRQSGRGLSETEIEEEVKKNFPTS